MARLRTITWSSVARKFINGITGLGLCLFIIFHLAGNLTLLWGTAEQFNAYSHFLMSTGVLVYTAEIVLLAFFVFHIITAVTVWWGKQMARPDSYQVGGNAGTPSKKTISSRTMIYTGAILFVFLVLHVRTFKYGPGIDQGYLMVVHGTPMRDLYRLAIDVFSKLGNVIWYVAVMALLGYHLRHGFWSAFQSLGANHPRCSPFIYGIALIFALIMAFGFLIIPVIIYFQGGAT
jgi:succinate dehydrogenase / fumarate reductase cytochrome b subunit